jgi:hypothetical protein
VVCAARLFSPIDVAAAAHNTQSPRPIIRSLSPFLFADAATQQTNKRKCERRKTGQSTRGDLVIDWGPCSISLFSLLLFALTVAFVLCFVLSFLPPRLDIRQPFALPPNFLSFHLFIHHPLEKQANTNFEDPPTHTIHPAPNNVHWKTLLLLLLILCCCE